MSRTEHTILCGTCKCPAESVPNPKPHDKVTCPRCHRSDRFDHVMRTVAKHVEHRTAQMMHDSLARATRDSKVLKLTSQRPGYQSFRWIAGNYGG